MKNHEVTYIELPKIADVYLAATGKSLNVVGRRRGSETIVQCPASGHVDSHPSCSINVEKNVFHCHGCGAGGGVLDLWVAAGKATDRSDAAGSLRDRGLIKR